MVVPHSLSDRAALRGGAGWISLTRTASPQALPVDPALFSPAATADACTRSAATSPDGTPPFRLLRPCSQRHPKPDMGPWLPEPSPHPILTRARAVLARFRRPEPSPEFRADTPVARCPTGRRVVILEPFRERSAGPKHTPAEQDQS